MEEMNRSAQPEVNTEAAEEVALDKNVRLMSPTRMVIRRFFRSRLSIVGLVMIVALFLFSWVGPLVYNNWGQSETDTTPKTEYTTSTVTYEVDGKTYTFVQVVETTKPINSLAAPS